MLNMHLSFETLKCLRDLINEGTRYRSGSQLVNFFNELGFNNVYEQGFPSRCFFTDECLKELNGTDGIEKCIKKIFNPREYISNISILDNYIKELNQQSNLMDGK